MDTQILTLSYVINNSKDIKISRDNDGNIVIDGDVIIYDKEYTRFPVKIHKVNGSIIWRGNTDGLTTGSLDSLINFPDIVTGDVNICKNMNLNSLKYCPSEIGGSLICDHCNLTDLNGLSKKIGKHLYAAYNPIKNVIGLEKSYVNGIINLAGTDWAEVNSNTDIKTLNDSSIISYADLQNNIYD